MGCFHRENDLMVPAEPKWPVKSLWLAAHILNSLDIFFSIVFRRIFLTSQSYYKVYLKRQRALKNHLSLLCWQAHSRGQSHWDYTLSSHHSKLTFGLYMPQLFISQMCYTDLARCLAHLTPTPLLECDNNYVFLNDFFKAENTQNWFWMDFTKLTFFENKFLFKNPLRNLLFTLSNISWIFYVTYRHVWSFVGTQYVHL